LDMRIEDRRGYSMGQREGDGMTMSGLRGRVWEVFRPTEDQWNSWKWHFQNRITTVEQLARLVALTRDQSCRLKHVSKEYPLSITPFYVALASGDDLSDPVLRQSVPSLEETACAGIGEDDPLKEQSHSPVPGLVHRYPDRVLMVVTDICPVFCRHCTRKREWRHGISWVRSASVIEAGIDYIRNNTAIRDVIISGGDPLVLDNARLGLILKRLRAIEHVEIIRIGTRFPVVLPQRIDEGFCRIVEEYGPIWLNTQFNHPNEVTPEASQAVQKLMRAGVPVNNQSVLLRGINDSVAVQMRLVHELLKIRVRPYYLYHADEVRGTEHFRTSIETGIDIVEGLTGHTSGFSVPTFVVDAVNGGGKIPLQPRYILDRTANEFVLRNFEGQFVHCRNPQPEGDSPSLQATTASASRPAWHDKENDE